jgi:hypothetical protein
MFNDIYSLQIGVTSAHVVEENALTIILVNKIFMYVTKIISLETLFKYKSNTIDFVDI